MTYLQSNSKIILTAEPNLDIFAYSLMLTTPCPNMVHLKGLSNWKLSNKQTVKRYWFKGLNLYGFPDLK